MKTVDPLAELQQFERRVLVGLERSEAAEALLRDRRDYTGCQRSGNGSVSEWLADVPVIPHRKAAGGKKSAGLAPSGMTDAAIHATAR